MSLLDKYSKQELENIVKNSLSYKDVAKLIGYTSYSGDLCDLIKEKIQYFNIDISHFKRTTNLIRTPENIFILNSTANQTTLRKWYLQGEYTPYICSICGQKPIWQGKELTLILDHINGKNKDDRLENLRWVCPNCNQQLDTTGAKNPQRKIIAKKYYCIDCGIEISNGSKRCVSCFNKSQIIPLSKMCVTREELKDLIRTKSFCEIGRMFNVTDNSIRKWCDKYNLPRKKSEIIKISDNDWSKI